jgi:hypothetical protein
MVLCYCGRDATVRTSWTSKNPGRRFFCCADTVSTSGSITYTSKTSSTTPKILFVEQASDCGFFCWYDQEMCCHRAMDIIPGLLRAKNELEMKLKMSEEATKKLKRHLIMTWIGFSVVLVAILMY